MASSSYLSPLRDFRGTLAFLDAVGGIPVRVSPEGALVFSRWEYLKLAVIWTILCAPGFAFAGVMSQTNKTMETFILNIYSMGYTTMDFATLLISTLFVGTFMMVIFRWWIKNRKEVSALCSSMADVSGSLPDVEGIGVKSKKAAMRRILTPIIFGTLGCVVNGVTSRLSFEVLDVDEGLKGLATASNFISVMLSYFGPIVVSSDLFVLYLTEYLSEMFKCWSRFGKANGKDKMAKKGSASVIKVGPWEAAKEGAKVVETPKDVSEHLDLGIRLCELFDEFTGAMGGIFFVLLSYGLLAGVSTGYGALAFVMNHRTVPIGCFSLSMGLFNAALSMHCIGICRAGQALVDAKAAAREIMEDRVNSMASAMSPTDAYKARILGDRLSEPVSPMSCFSLEKPTLMSLAGNCFTYLIVLLQFKIGVTDDPLLDGAEDAAAAASNATTAANSSISAS